MEKIRIDICKLALVSQKGKMQKGKVFQGDVDLVTSLSTSAYGDGTLSVSGRVNFARPDDIVISQSDVDQTVNDVIAIDKRPGESNLKIGFGNLSDLVGEHNIVIGNDTLEDMLSGSSNIAMGVGSGKNVTEGSGNIFIGHGSDISGSGPSDHRIGFGHQANPASDWDLQIGKSGDPMHGIGAKANFYSQKFVDESWRDGNIRFAGIDADGNIAKTDFEFIDGDFTVPGKLTVGGGIDPTYLALTPVANKPSNPGDPATNMLWVKIGNTWFKDEEPFAFGPAISTDTAIPTFANATGSAFRNSTVLIDALSNISGARTLSIVSSAIAEAEPYISLGSNSNGKSSLLQFETGDGATSKKWHLGSLFSNLGFEIRNTTDNRQSLYCDPATGVVSLPLTQKVDTISEYTTGSGVTVDGVLLKDNGIVIQTHSLPNAIALPVVSGSQWNTIGYSYNAFAQRAGSNGIDSGQHISMNIDADNNGTNALFRITANGLPGIGQTIFTVGETGSTTIGGAIESNFYSATVNNCILYINPSAPALNSYFYMGRANQGFGVQWGQSWYIGSTEQISNIIGTGVDHTFNVRKFAGAGSPVPSLSPDFLFRVYGDETGIQLGNAGQKINEFSTDGTLSDNSDTAIPTEKAVKTYVDSRDSINSPQDIFMNIDSDNTGTNALFHITANGTPGADLVTVNEVGKLVVKGQIESNYNGGANSLMFAIAPTGGAANQTFYIGGDNQGWGVQYGHGWFEGTRDKFTTIIGSAFTWSVNTWDGTNPTRPSASTTRRFTTYGDGTGIQIGTGQKINEFSTDGTLSDNSDIAIPTEKAVKTYVDAHSGQTIAFTNLTDTFPNYTLANSLIRVKSGVDGLEETVIQLENAGENQLKFISGTSNFGISETAIFGTVVNDKLMNIDCTNSLGITIGNVMIGKEAMMSVTTAIGGTAYGHGALALLQEGNFNSAFGNLAGSALVDGEFNTIVGSGSVPEMEHGNGNLVLGATAGLGVVTSNHCIFLGTETGTISTDNALEMICIGHGATADDPWSIQIGKPTGSANNAKAHIYSQLIVDEAWIDTNNRLAGIDENGNYYKSLFDIASGNLTVPGSLTFSTHSLSNTINLPAVTGAQWNSIGYASNSFTQRENDNGIDSGRHISMNIDVDNDGTDAVFRINANGLPGTGTQVFVVTETGIVTIRDSLQFGPMNSTKRFITVPTPDSADDIFYIGYSFHDINWRQNLVELQSGKDVSIAIDADNNGTDALFRVYTDNSTNLLTVTETGITTIRGQVQCQNRVGANNLMFYFNPIGAVSGDSYYVGNVNQGYGVQYGSGWYMGCDNWITNIIGSAATWSVNTWNGTNPCVPTNAPTKRFTVYGDGTGIQIGAGQKINEFSTDGNLADNSDTAIPTEKAIKTYIDQSIAMQRVKFSVSADYAAAINAEVEFDVERWNYKSFPVTTWTGSTTGRSCKRAMATVKGIYLVNASISINPDDWGTCLTIASATQVYFRTIKVLSGWPAPPDDSVSGTVIVNLEEDEFPLIFVRFQRTTGNSRIIRGAFETFVEITRLV